MLILIGVDDAGAKAGLVGGVGILPSTPTSTTASPLRVQTPALAASTPTVGGGAARATVVGLEEETGTPFGVLHVPLGYSPGDK